MKTILLAFLFTLNLFANDVLNKKMFQNGEEIYYETCVSCHGESGETNPEIKLVVKPRKLNSTILTQEQSLLVIKEGAHHWGAHADIMPAFKYVYTQEQMLSVAYYITQKFNPKGLSKTKKLLKESKPLEYTPEKALKVGEKIFKRNCSLCHGITGNGESIYVEESKENDTFIYPYNLRRTLLNEDQIFLYAKFGGHFWGTDKTDMPSWKKKYNDEKLKSVARYVQLKIKEIKE